MDEESFDIYGDDLTGGATTQSKPADNEDDLLYGDLGGEEGSANKGANEGQGEEDLELNLYEVGDKAPSHEDEDEDRDRRNERNRGLERDRYGGGDTRQNKDAGQAYGAQQQYGGARAPPGGYGQQQQQQRPPQQPHLGGAPQPQMTGPQDVPALYIGNLTWWTTDKDLEDICSHFGKVKQVKFFENKQNGRSKGYALVEFYDAEASRQAKEKLHGFVIHDKQCMVNFVSPQTLAELNAPGKKSKTGGGPPQISGGRPPMQRQPAPNVPPSSQRPMMGGRGGRGFMPGGPYGPDGSMPPGMPGGAPFIRFPGGIVPGMGRGGSGGRGIMGHSPYGPDFFPMMPVPGAHVNPAFFKDQMDDMYRGRPDYHGRDERDDRDRERERDRERDRDRAADRGPDREREGERERASERDRDRERDSARADRGPEPRDRDREREREREKEKERERDRDRGRERGSTSESRSRKSSDRGEDRGSKREREEARASEGSSSSRAHKDDDRKRRRGDSSDSGRHERR